MNRWWQLCDVLLKIVDDGISFSYIHLKPLNGCHTLRDLCLEISNGDALLVLLIIHNMEELIIIPACHNFIRKPVDLSDKSSCDYKSQSQRGRAYGDGLRVENQGK